MTGNELVPVSVGSKFEALSCLEGLDDVCIFYQL